MLANNLPVERAGHAGEVKSEILCDVGGLLFGVCVDTDGHRCHGHNDFDLCCQTMAGICLTSCLAIVIHSEDFSHAYRMDGATSAGTRVCL